MGITIDFLQPQNSYIVSYYKHDGDWSFGRLLPAIIVVNQQQV